MYGPTDLKKGRVIVVDGKPYQVVEYQQKVMGRGGSIVNVRIKNLIDGSVLAKTYKGQEKIEAAEVSNQTAQRIMEHIVKFAQASSKIKLRPFNKRREQKAEPHR